MEVKNANGKVIVKIGVNFTKIRNFNILIMFFICAVIPAFLAYIKHGIPDIPPMSYLGIPLGVLVHYHVRWRVFNTLGKLIRQLRDNK